MFTRRSVLALAAAPLLAAPRRYRVAVIGHTGRGNYGHGIDTVWRTFDNLELVAVADADQTGRAAASKRLGVARTYADYREMLRREKPDIVGIAPRWMDQRLEMVTAVAEAGAHIYMEKPFALTLADADRMAAAVQRNKVKLQIAHQMRRSPFALQAKAWIAEGEIGGIQEIRTRGKEDRRAGGEDMMVLGSHLCDMLRFFLGNPQWTTAHVTTAGREINGSDVKQPSEPIGAIAGTQGSSCDGGTTRYADQRDVCLRAWRAWLLRITGSGRYRSAPLWHLDLRQQGRDLSAERHLSRWRAAHFAFALVAARCQELVGAVGWSSGVGQAPADRERIDGGGSAARH